MGTRKILIPLVIVTIVVTFNFRSDKDLISSYKKLDANYVSAFFKNNGIFNHNFETGTAGFEWESGSGRYCRYKSNLVLGAIISQDTIISAEGDFQPGYIDDNGIPQGRDDPAFRVYKITKGDTTSEDYLNWPIGQGAYIHPDDKPYLIGKQTLFSSYTDGYQDNISGNTIPMKAQVLETDWAFNVPGPAGTAVFSEFRIINRSANVWNDFYAGIFTDDDIGEADDDMIDSDSSRNIAYTYNSINNSGIYGAAPPAVSFNILSGSALYTGNINDSVIIYSPVTSENRIVKRGYKDLFLTSFNPVLDSNPLISNPANDIEYFNLLKGLKKDGSVWINPNTNQPTRFPYGNFGAGDYKFLISSGPVSVNPGDTQTVIIAQLVARGSTNLASITSLKSGNTFLNALYNTNFYTVSINDPAITVLPDKYTLYQNYPNPFNPVTKIRYNIPVASNVKLTVYDVMGKEVITLVNGKQDAGDKEVTFSATGSGNELSSGIYFYKINVNDYLPSVRKMVLQK